MQSLVSRGSPACDTEVKTIVCDVALDLSYALYHLINQISGASEA